jgi:hypothetical protein
MGPFLFKMNIEGDKIRNFFSRIVWELEGCPGFIMNGRSGRRLSKHGTAVSLPMFAKYSRINIDDIPMNKLLIKLKDPFNAKHINKIKHALVNSLENQGLHNLYEIWSYSDEIETSKSVS